MPTSGGDSPKRRDTRAIPLELPPAQLQYLQALADGEPSAHVRAAVRVLLAAVTPIASTAESESAANPAESSPGAVVASLLRLARSAHSPPFFALAAWTALRASVPLDASIAAELLPLAATRVARANDLRQALTVVVPERPDVWRRVLAAPHALRPVRGLVSVDQTLREIVRNIRFSTAAVLGTQIRAQGPGSGKWYYEVVLINQGLVQLGWSTEEAQYNDEMGLGVGDDRNSWSWCVQRNTLFNGPA
jgi:hypothetical protein